MPNDLPVRRAAEALTQAQKATIDALSTDARTISAPVWLAHQAHVPNDALERAWAAEDLRPGLRRGDRFHGGG
jgi:hypothetical protein